MATAPNPSATVAVTACTVSDCQCPFHRANLPPPDLRWYAVIVGTNPGVYQGHTRANELTCYVSGGSFYFFATQEEARAEFERAVRNKMAIKVVPTLQVVLSHEDLSDIPGFRVGDPLGPEYGDWAVVIVGRTPGIFLSSPGSPILRGNIVSVKHAHVVYTKSRSAAAHEFMTSLDLGAVMSVRSDLQRIILDESIL